MKELAYADPYFSVKHKIIKKKQSIESKRSLQIQNISLIELCPVLDPAAMAKS